MKKPVSLSMALLVMNMACFKKALDWRGPVQKTGTFTRPVAGKTKLELSEQKLTNGILSGRLQLYETCEQVTQFSQEERYAELTVTSDRGSIKRDISYSTETKTWEDVRALPQSACKVRPLANQRGELTAFASEDEFPFTTDSSGRFSIDLSSVPPDEWRYGLAKNWHIESDDYEVTFKPPEMLAVRPPPPPPPPPLPPPPPPPPPQHPPRYEITVVYKDGTGELKDVLEGGETATLQVGVRNTGKGKAVGLKASIKAAPTIDAGKPILLGNLAPGEAETVTFNLTGKASMLGVGTERLLIVFEEDNGFPPPPHAVEIKTDRQRQPKPVFVGLEIFDGMVGNQSGNGDKKPQSGEQVEMKGVLQNQGDGTIRDAEIVAEAKTPGVLVKSVSLPIPQLPPSAGREVMITLAFPSNLPAPRQEKVNLIVRRKYDNIVLAQKTLTYNVLPPEATETVIAGTPYSGSEFAFIGFGIGETSGKEAILDSATIKMLNNIVQDNLKSLGIGVQVPDVSETMDKVKEDVRLCSDVECTAAIAGAMGLEHGLFGKVEETPDGRVVLFLNLVNQSKAAITAEVFVETTKPDLRQTTKIREIGHKLALEMFRKMSGG